MHSLLERELLHVTRLSSTTPGTKESDPFAQLLSTVISSIAGTIDAASNQKLSQTTALP